MVTDDADHERCAPLLHGELVGLTLVRPKRLLERESELRITVPVPSAVPAAELTPALST